MVEFLARKLGFKILLELKPVLVTTNVVGLQTAFAGNVGQKAAPTWPKEAVCKLKLVNVATETGLMLKFLLII